MSFETKCIVPVNLADRDLFREYWVERTVEEIKKHTYINPLYDTGFKAFLSDEQAQVNFLNGVFRTNEKNRIESATIKNSEIGVGFSFA